MINKRSMTKAPSLINRGVDRKTNRTRWRPQMIQDPNLRSDPWRTFRRHDFQYAAMKGTARFLLILAIGTALPSLGQVASSSPSGQGNSDFEELPELKASEILKPEVFQGPHHMVRESVPTLAFSTRTVMRYYFAASKKFMPLLN